ncbi:MAG: hypothetical protein IJE08_14470 [Clostridia bacterium]|nr:hypothetical protein [Clostridia bacterium]
MSGIFFVEPGYVPGPVNPITGRNYEHGWICLRLTDEAEYEVFCSGRELYCAAISKQNPGWKYRVMDFVEYSLGQGKDVIFSGERADYEAARKAYAGHHHKDRTLRPHEMRVLVHSATPDGYPSIVRMGALKSRKLLIQEGVISEKKPSIGRKLCAAEDFEDYVMLSQNGVDGELVIASKQLGRIESSPDVPYRPGARFYFDAEAIALDGLLVRDGLHLKVERKLPLAAYLLWTATPENVDPAETEWTPGKFAEKADKSFEAWFGEV